MVFVLLPCLRSSSVFNGRMGATQMDLLIVSNSKIFLQEMNITICALFYDFGIDQFSSKWWKNLHILMVIPLIPTDSEITDMDLYKKHWNSCVLKHIQRILKE